ncbi:pyridoxamine 5-phosphate oxidase [Streptacidiphilus sp. 4-A2]|nr:pyridoxamine 5-phosphate oxidase [Streptacidiphilus sp. 4-A2]
MEDDRPVTGSLGERLLQEELGTVRRADAFYRDQVLDHLNHRMREFITRQEMVLIATADAGGHCDSSLRAGPAGFVRILGRRTLAYPDYRGNGVMASLGNITENPHIGLLFLDFGPDRIGLHVNGEAQLVADQDMREHHPALPVDPVPGRRATVWVEVSVHEAYVHCSKHIPRMERLTGSRRDWGTDDPARKGGDWFGTAATRHPTDSPEPAHR